MINPETRRFYKKEVMMLAWFCKKHLKLLWVCISVLTLLSAARLYAQTVPVWPTLNVLSLYNIGAVQGPLLAQFEAQNHVRIRMEFAANTEELIPKLNNDLRSYDMVIAPEDTLIRLTLNKRLVRLPQALWQQQFLDEKNVTHTDGLYTPTTVNIENQTYYAFMADPLVVAYRKDVLAQFQPKQAQMIKNKISWNDLVDTDLYPLWRQRLFAGYDIKTLWAQSLLATGFLSATTPLANTFSEQPPEAALTYFKKLCKQNRLPIGPVALAFLNQDILVSVMFLSQFMHTLRFVPNLSMQVPQPTFFRRVGFGFVSNFNVQKKDLLLVFGRFIISHTHEWIGYTHHGFLPLSVDSFEGSLKNTWILEDNNHAIDKNLLRYIKKQKTKSLSYTVCGVG